MEQPPTEYRRDGEEIIARYSIPGGKAAVTFCAKDLRDFGQYGTHAVIFVDVNGSTISYDDLALMKADDRVKLANKVTSKLRAHGHTDLASALDPKGEELALPHLLDEFCAGLWEFYNQSQPDEPSHIPDEPRRKGFFLSPLVMKGAGTIIYGTPASGKSLIALLMMASLNGGSTHLWQWTSRARVLFVNLERSGDSVLDRLFCAHRCLNLPTDDEVYIINARGKSLESIERRARQMVRRYEIDVVILDAISRAGYKGSLNDDTVANAIMNMLASLTPTWVAVGHTSKTNSVDGRGNGIFGSQMFTAATDLAVLVERRKMIDQTNKGIVCKLTCTKANDTPFFDAQYIAIEFEPEGMTSAYMTDSSQWMKDADDSGDSPTDMITHILMTDEEKLTVAELMEKSGLARPTVSIALNSGLYESEPDPDSHKGRKLWRMKD